MSRARGFASFFSRKSPPPHYDRQPSTPTSPRSVWQPATPTSRSVWQPATPTSRSGAYPESPRVASAATPKAEEQPEPSPHPHEATKASMAYSQDDTRAVTITATGTSNVGENITTSSSAEPKSSPRHNVVVVIRAAPDPSTQRATDKPSTQEDEDEDTAQTQADPKPSAQAEHKPPTQEAAEKPPPRQGEHTLRTQQAHSGASYKQVIAKSVHTSELGCALTVKICCIIAEFARMDYNNAMDLKIDHEEWLHMLWQGDDHERAGRINLSIKSWLRALDCLEEYQEKMQKVDFSEEVWNDMDEDITKHADPVKRQRALLLYIRTWRVELHQKLARAYWKQCERRFAKRMKKAAATPKASASTLVATLRRTLTRSKTSPRAGGVGSNPILKPPRAAATGRASPRSKAKAQKLHRRVDSSCSTTPLKHRRAASDASSATSTAPGNDNANAAESEFQEERKEAVSTPQNTPASASATTAKNATTTTNATTKAAPNPILRQRSRRAKVDPRERTIFHTTKLIDLLDTEELREKAGGAERYKATPAWSFVVTARHLRGQAHFARVEMEEAQEDLDAVLADWSYAKLGAQGGDKKGLRASTESLLKMVNEALEAKSKLKKKQVTARRRRGRLARVLTFTGAKG